MRIPMPMPMPMPMPFADADANDRFRSALLSGRERSELLSVLGSEAPARS